MMRALELEPYAPDPMRPNRRAAGKRLSDFASTDELVKAWYGDVSKEFVRDAYHNNKQFRAAVLDLEPSPGEAIERLKEIQHEAWRRR